MIVAKAILVGWAVVVATALPWPLLAAANLRTTPQIPWSVPIVLIYVWAAWHYLNGSGPPHRTASRRHELLRARPLGRAEWKDSLFAATPAIVALWLLYAIAAAFAHAAPPARSLLPIQSAIAATIASAVVAALSEEAGYRGYMQQVLEARFGPVLAVITTSLTFAVSHITHGWSALALMPLYFLAGCIYGTTAFLTNSILPSLALHLTGDLFLFSMPLLGFHFLHPATGPGLVGLVCALALATAGCAFISFRRFACLTSRKADLPVFTAAGAGHGRP
jgi:membrane protease YdiL (CAAX protease family)